MKNLEIEVKTDFGPALEKLRAETGADLQPRPEGFHITVIGPTESKVLKNLDDENIAELQAINAAIQQGEGVTADGIGFIDGSDSDYQVREADIAKKTAFVALDIPKLQAFREKVGLPQKDFHVTLGFEGGDIHFHVTGEEEYKPGKFKEKREPVPKRADDRFDSIVANLPHLQFGGLSGEMKPEKKKVPQPEAGKKKEKKPKSYDGEKLRGLLSELVANGKSGGITADRIDAIVELATTDPNSLGRELRADFRFLRPLLAQSEREG